MLHNHKRLHTCAQLTAYRYEKNLVKMTNEHVLAENATDSELDKFILTSTGRNKCIRTRTVSSKFANATSKSTYLYPPFFSFHFYRARTKT